MKMVKELLEKGYKPFCRGAMCPPIPVRKIALGIVEIKEEWQREYKLIDSNNCIARIATDGKECENCDADDCDRWETDEGEEIRTIECFALDLGTSGVAGQGYDEEEHWYFSEDYEVDHRNKRIIFSVPLLGGLYYENENRYLNGYGKVCELIADLTETWSPRMQCGCI